MNVRVVAALLSAEKELERIESALRRQQAWRDARKISAVRATLSRTLTYEQESLGARYAEYQANAV